MVLWSYIKTKYFLPQYFLILAVPIYLVTYIKKIKLNEEQF